MSERAILAIDQGTTSSRAIVFDPLGVALGSAQTSINQHYPQPGWVNHDAGEIWTSTTQVARDAIAAAEIPLDKIAAIGITNQRETTILWDRATGQPVAPAIVWQSRQSVPQVEAIARRGMTETYQRRTGLVPDAYFSATKIAWLLEHDPDLARRAEAGDICFGTVDSWLVWNLTGGREHVIDATNAGRTMLVDIHRVEWDRDLLADLAIPLAMLPRIVDSSGFIAETDPDVLGAAIPIAGVAGDQHAALFGQGCFTEGAAKNTYGTGSFLLMNTGTATVPSQNRLLTTLAWRMRGETTYALEGAIFVTGSAIQWLRDGLGIIQSSAEVEPLAASVPGSEGVVFVPALAGLGAPDWDPHARGTIFGITRGTTRAHIVRATLEAITYQTRDVLDAMAADRGGPVTELRVDGGATVNNLLMQMQADVLGVPVVRPKVTETTALGAAYLAGYAVGVWDTLDELSAQWRVDRRFEPSMSRDEADSRFARWRNAVERSRGWARDG